MKIFSANVVLTVIKVSIAFTNSLLSFRSRTRISYVSAGKAEQDRAEKDSLLMLIVQIWRAQNLAQDFKKDLDYAHGLMIGHCEHNILFIKCFCSKSMK